MLGRFVITLIESKHICSFEAGEMHTHAIVLVAMEAILSAMLFKDFHVQFETPVTCLATPHFWRKMQMKTLQVTSRNSLGHFVAY